MQTTRFLSKSLLALALCASVATPLLSGCVAVGAAALATGSLAATDRRTIGIQVEDRSIQLKATSGLREKFGSSANVTATVFNRQVLLTGQAADAASVKEAERVIANIPNVRAIVNDIQVAPTAPLSARSRDTLLTTKVKATFVDAQDVYANAFKVTSESGVVYLMGLVTDREANRAADLTSTIPGVTKVVKVVDVISEDELAKLRITPSNGVEHPVGNE